MLWLWPPEPPPKSPPRSPPRPPPELWVLEAAPPPPEPAMEPITRLASQAITSGARMGRSLLKREEPPRVVAPRVSTTRSCRSPKMWPMILTPSSASTAESGSERSSRLPSWSRRRAAPRASPPPEETLPERPPSRTGRALRAASMAVSGSVPSWAASSSAGIWARISSVMLAMVSSFWIVAAWLKHHRGLDGDGGARQNETPSWVSRFKPAS